MSEVTSGLVPSDFATAAVFMSEPESEFELSASVVANVTLHLLGLVPEKFAPQVFFGEVVAVKLMIFDCLTMPLASGAQIVLDRSRNLTGGSTLMPLLQLVLKLIESETFSPVALSRVDESHFQRYIVDELDIQT